MQVNLLSLFSGAASVEAGAVEAKNGVASLTPEQLAAQAALAEAEGAESGETSFDHLFDGSLEQLGEGVDQGAEALPTPKLMAAFMQRLHLIVPEGGEVDLASQTALAGQGGQALGLTEALPQLSEEQILAMAKVMGIDPQLLQQNIQNQPIDGAEIASFTGQIFPSDKLAEVDSAFGTLVSALKELAQLGQKMQAQGLTLVEAGATVELTEGEGEAVSLLSLLGTKGDESAQLEAQDLEVSQEAIAYLAQLFNVPQEQLEQNISGLKLVPVTAFESIENLVVEPSALEDAAKAPGLLQLVASVLNKPVEEVWDQLEQVTDGEVDIPLGIVFSAIIAKETPSLIGGLGVSPSTESNAAIAINPTELGGGYAAGALPLNPIGGKQSALAQNVEQASKVAGALRPTVDNKSEPRFNTASSAAEFEDLPELPSANSPRFPEKLETVAESSRSLSSFAATQAREFTPARAAALARNTAQPLLREAAERPLGERATAETPSSIALSASDSALDFDSRVRESRNNIARETMNHQNVREQVAVQVKQGVARGDTQINIRLNPHELGRVEVRVDVNADGRAVLAIVADNKDTLELLQRDSRSLERAFADMGMEISDSGMSFDLNEQFTGQEQDSENNNGQPEEKSAAFDNLLGNGDELMAEALLDGSSPYYSVEVEDGLNIRI